MDIKPTLPTIPKKEIWRFKITHSLIVIITIIAALSFAAAPITGVYALKGRCPFFTPIACLMGSLILLQLAIYFYNQEAERLSEKGIPLSSLHFSILK